jgi:hypothetical protein
MPSVSKSQQRLFAAAEHGATFQKAEELRGSLTHQQLHDFAATKTKNLPNRTKSGYRSSKAAARSQRGR